jgi:hypothetical protein
MVVDLGVLTLNKIVPNSSDAEKKLLFLPRTSPPASNFPTIRCRACALLPMVSRSAGARRQRDVPASDTTSAPTGRNLYERET